MKEKMLSVQTREIETLQKELLQYKTKHSHAMKVEIMEISTDTCITEVQISESELNDNT